MIPLLTLPQPERKIVSIRNLKYVYEDGIEALRNINLDIRPGEYIAIVGGNGSGKTTLAKTINGLLIPTSGSVVVNGKDTKQCSVTELARHVGYAFQNPDHQLFCATVDEEIRFGPRNLGLSQQEIEAKVGHAMDVMDLASVRDQPPLSLTLGQRRRISIASVLAMDPSVIVLDEPTTGLDAGEEDDLMSHIDVLNKEGHTLILITHDMRLVAKHARRAVVMAAGRVLLDSEPRGAFCNPDLLLQGNLRPPSITLLAHRLAHLGVPGDIVSPEEMVLHLLRGGEDG